MLELITGKDLLERINDDDLIEISNLINNAWGSHTIVTPEILLGRMKSQENIFVGYDDGKLCSVLETKVIRNDKPVLPTDATYNHLTNNGIWNNNPYTSGDVEILLLVDIAAQGRGNGRKTITLAKKFIANQTDYEHVLTFTPDIQKVRDWHQSCGATVTDYRVMGARPRYHPGRDLPDTDKPENVRAMSYSNIIKEMRDK